MSDDQHVALGLDLGGTTCKLGIFDVKTQKLVDHTTSPIKDGSRPGEDLFEQFCNAAEGMLRGQGMTPAQVVSSCIASAGILGPDGAKEPGQFEEVVNSPNIRGINGFNIKGAVKARFPNSLTFIENDAKAHGWAEWFFGAGTEEGVHSLVGFTLGTGLGGYMIVDGQMVRPGELGHIRVETADDAPRSPAGEKGAAEAFVSKAGIRRLGREFLQQYPESRLKDIGERPEGFDPLPIAKAAEEGDEACRLLYEQVGIYLGRLIRALKRVCSPDVIVCSGNIANDLHLMMPGVQEALNDDSLFPKNPIIKKTALGPDKAGIIGAGALAIHGFKQEA